MQFGPKTQAVCIRGGSAPSGSASPGPEAPGRPWCEGGRRTTRVSSPRPPGGWPYCWQQGDGHWSCWFSKERVTDNPRRGDARLSSDCRSSRGLTSSHRAQGLVALGNWSHSRRTRDSSPARLHLARAVCPTAAMSAPHKLPRVPLMAEVSSASLWKCPWGHSLVRRMLPWGEGLQVRRQHRSPHALALPGRVPHPPGELGCKGA